jgi:hypothetical protein
MSATPKIKTPLLIGIVLIVGIGAVVVLFRTRRGPSILVRQPIVEPIPGPLVTKSPPRPPADTRDLTGNRFKIKRDALTDEEKARFTVDFQKKFKPAVANWFQAYAGRVPFSLEDLNPEAFKERIGGGNSHDYVFVVDGVTIAVRDQPTQTFVSYMNSPDQSRHLMELPADGRPPITTPPVSRSEVAQMIEQDAGVRFTDDQIRMGLSGLSSGLNGGVHVEVGGDPENVISWKFSLVFGKDGKLVYYMTAPFKMAKPPKS